MLTLNTFSHSELLLCIPYYQSENHQKQSLDFYFNCLNVFLPRSQPSEQTSLFVSNLHFDYWFNNILSEISFGAGCSYLAACPFLHRWLSAALFWFLAAVSLAIWIYLYLWASCLLGSGSFLLNVVFFP